MRKKTSKKSETLAGEAQCNGSGLGRSNEREVSQCGKMMFDVLMYLSWMTLWEGKGGSI